MVVCSKRFAYERSLRAAGRYRDVMSARVARLFQLLDRVMKIGWLLLGASIELRSETVVHCCLTEPRAHSIDSEQKRCRSAFMPSGVRCGKRAEEDLRELARTASSLQAPGRQHGWQARRVLVQGSEVPIAGWTRSTSEMSEVSDRGSVLEARRSRLAWGQYLEVLGLTLAVPVIGYVARVPDPFFVHAAFPWLALVALLIGAQHGVVPALLAAGLTSAGGLAHAVATGGNLEGLRTWSVGCILVALVTGWFRDQAEARREQLAARMLEAERRSQRLWRAHRVLQLSQARLEERLLAEGWSLESIVRQASRELGRAASCARVYEVVLEVLSSEGQLHAASLFVCACAEGRVRLEPVPAAQLGKQHESAPQHPLVQRVLATGKAALLAPERWAETQEEAVLAALPLVTSGGRWLGVVAVSELPFIAFSPEAFSDLSAIAERLADLVEPRLAVLASGAAALRQRAELVAPFDRALPSRELEHAVPVHERESRAQRRPPSGVRLKLEDRLARGGAAPASSARRRGERS